MYKRMSLMLASIIAVGCYDGTLVEPGADDVAPSFSIETAEDIDAYFTATMIDANAALEGMELDFRVASVEWMGHSTPGQLLFFSDFGTTYSGMDFVANDPRRAPWSGPSNTEVDNITWAVDETADATPRFGGISGADTDAAISRAMGTWDELACSNPALTRNSSFGLDLGVVAFLNGLGGSPFVVADIQHTGFTDINFGGGVIGAALSFIWVDGGGQPTDIDGDGRLDVAFREIYYDPSWRWGIGGAVDVETIALHETGHGLSQLHFGKLFGTFGNGKLHLAPKAVMNAGYTGPLTDLQGTDVGGHCEIWASWGN